MVRRIIRVFENTADTYDDWYHEPVGSYAFQSELKGLMKLLPLTGTGVDIGAGTGIFAEQLTTDQRKIICIDPSPEMLKVANRRHLETIIAVAETLPITLRSIDFAYMVTVLEFLPEPLMALESIRGILKDNSPLVILFINQESSWGERYSKQAMVGDLIFSHARIYKLEEVCALLKRSNYDPEELIGTLTAPPDKPGKEVELVSVGPETGAIFIKARKIGIDY